MTTTTKERFLDVKDVAEMLGVGSDTVYRMAAQGILPAFKSSPGRRGRWRFTESAILAWVKKQEQANMDRKDKVDEAIAQAGAAPQPRPGARKS